MQTFLTSTDPNPLRAAKNTFTMLDMPRLGKQRSEAWQLLNGSFPNHPAAKMWVGHHHALIAYGIICSKVWRVRGGNDEMLGRFVTARASMIDQGVPLVWPWWYGHPAFVRCHQSKLYFKGSTKWLQHQERIGLPAGMEPMRLPYLWPDVDDEGVFRISVAEQKRDDWEIPSSWAYDHKTRIVVPR